MSGFGVQDVTLSKRILPEEAVMKLVENLDQHVVKAEAMQLTKVGFIDCLREVNRQRIFTVKKIKDDFKKRLDLIVEAKKYEVKCQRIVAIDAAKRVVSETIKTSKNLFNSEVKAFRNQYQSMLNLIEYFESVVKD